MKPPKKSVLFVTTQDNDSPESVSISPLSLYSSYEKIDIELRRPHDMPGYHWHGQVEVNIPFGGDVEYIINGSPIVLKDGHIGLFWASIPHRLTNPGNCHNMGIINIPIHHFLSWPLNREFVNQITHGAVLHSDESSLVSEFELKRWEDEMMHQAESRQQLAADEISLMLKRLCLTGWSQMLTNRKDKPTQNGVSKHSQFYVSQMLEYIATHHDTPLTVKQIADHVGYMRIMQWVFFSV